jgi:hypothetical protein
MVQAPNYIITGDLFFPGDDSGIFGKTLQV